MNSSFSLSSPESPSDTTDCTLGRGSSSAGRVLRARRFRRQFDAHRPTKQLFTPEIKRYLKSWLVRRRDNPYPSREEKKDLAVQTGLTYIQICNWFANWRRKLKNTGKEYDKTTWGTLIKTYNGQVEGNVEQFSLSSEDSIWREPETAGPLLSPNYPSQKPEDHSYTTEPLPQCFQISSSSDFTNKRARDRYRDAKYQSLKPYSVPHSESCSDSSTPLLLRRWLKSAACFQPRQGSYLPQAAFHIKTSRLYEDILSSMHGREELAAAEALTFLSRASRAK